MITQRDLDLIANPRAFSPDPVRIEAGWASWLAGIGFIVMLAVLVLGGMTWTQTQALALCREIEAICPDYGCHVALTGGLLYKDGPRKDCDILFYRIRQVEMIDTTGLFLALAAIGVNYVSGFGWCWKAEFEGRKIDCFFPEESGGEYVRADAADMPIFDEVF